MSNIFPFRFSLNLCNAPPLQFERGKEEGDQGESSRHTLDQLQNANSPISGSLFDRFNRLHTLVPSSLRTERKERQKSVISLSLSPSLPPSLARSREVRYLHGDRVREKHSFLYRQNVLSCPCGSSPRPLSPTPSLFTSFFPPPPLSFRGLRLLDTYTRTPRGRN